MKRSFLFFISIICLSKSFSQNRNNIWYFGEYAGINFNTSPPTSLNNSVMVQHEGCATMCNTNGQLLMYTNGITVWNRNHQVLLNGDGLLGGQSATQSALIVPKPASNSIYYIFTVPQEGMPVPFSYSIVDMTLDGGLGGITATKNVALHTPVTEKLTGTFKNNGVDYWILVKELGTDAFLAYSLTSGGIDINPVVSHSGFIPVLLNDVGYMRISPNGSKMAIAYQTSDHFQLFDFDNNTGIVSNPIDLISSPTSIMYPYGVEFSPDNTKLYMLQEEPSKLWQYDLLAGSGTNIQNSAVTITTLGQNLNGGALALGPDNKIYVNRYMYNNVAYIDQPNLLGTACHYVSQGIPLASGSLSRIGFPNNINSPLVPNNCPASLNFSNAISICSNQTYQLPSGTIVNAAGTYLDTIRNVANTCDSILYTINVSIYNASLLNTFVHICPGQTYQLPSGTIVNAEGTYIDTLRNQSSCDSVINTIHVFVDHVSLQNTEAHVCPGQSFTLPSGIIVNAEGIYPDTLRSQAFCDSIINTVHLIVDHVIFQNAEVHICPSQTYQLPSGMIVSAEGIYQDTLRSQAYCDSIINTIHLFVDHAKLLNANASICSNQTYVLPSGTIATISGIYIDTLRSQTYCDSIISTIDLVVNDISTTNQVDSIYDGQVYTLPSGLTVSSAGSYQSILTNSLGCDSVINTILKLKKSIAECITLKNAITPNGDGINDYWILYRDNCFKRLEVNVYNRYGSLVYHSDDYKNDWNGKYKNKELPDGTYYYVIKVISFDGKEHLFKDNVTILR